MRASAAWRCVSACPDTAILATAQPRAALAASHRGLRRDRSAPDPAKPSHRRGHFCAHAEVRRRVPSARASKPAPFGIFVDPIHCKGCAECVEVCAQPGPRRAGHDRQGQPTTETTPSRRSSATGATCASSASLPPTPAEYRNEKALADLMLGEHAIGYVGGAGSCSGCGEATALRMLVAATRQVHGPKSMGMVAATGCNTVYGSTYPFNPFLVPWTNSLFENAPADAHGHPRALGPGRSSRAPAVGRGRRRRDVRHRLPVAVAHGRRRAPTSRSWCSTRRPTRTPVARRRRPSFGGQITKLSAFGKQHPRPARAPQGARRESCSPTARCTWPRPRRRTSTTSTARSWTPTSIPGPAVLVVYTPVPARARHRRRRVATSRRAWRSTRAPSRSSPTTRAAASPSAERLSLQGNPARQGRLVDAARRQHVRLPGLRPHRGTLRAALRRRG